MDFDTTKSDNRIAAAQHRMSTAPSEGLTRYWFRIWKARRRTYQLWLRKQRSPLPNMIFPEPVDAHTIPNRGVVYVTTLPEECRRRDLELLQGTTVTLGGKPFRVRGVESRCVDRQLKGWPIGLLGEYLGDIPGTRPLTPDDVEEMNRER